MKYFMLFLMAAGVILLGAGPAAASESRIGAMGDVGLFTEDNTSILTYPGDILQYRDLLTLELRTKSVDNVYTVNGNFGLGRKLVLGGYVNQPLSIPVPAAALGTFSNITLDRTLQVILGIPLARRNLGLSLNVGLDNYVSESGGTRTEQSGYSISLMGGLSDASMDLSAAVHVPSFEASVGSAKTTLSGFGLGLNGRIFLGKDEELKLVPIFHLSYSSAASKSGSTTTTKYNQIDFRTGLGVNYKFMKNNLLVMGFEARFDQDVVEVVPNPTSTVTDRVITFPGIYCGVESQLTKWMTGRAGAIQRYNLVLARTEAAGTAESSNWNSPFTFTLGTAINWGQFIIDASLNEDLFFEGPDFITGNGAAGSDFAQTISVIYSLK